MSEKNKFKAGDTVRAVNPGWGIGARDIGKICRITSFDGFRSGHNRYSVGSELDFTSCSKDICECSFELAWAPEHGETVEVRTNGTDKFRTFLCMDGNQYICKGSYAGNGLASYSKVFEHKPTHKITIDGQSAEISAESMEALKKLLLK